MDRKFEPKGFTMKISIIVNFRDLVYSGQGLNNEIDLRGSIWNAAVLLNYHFSYDPYYKLCILPVARG